MRYRRPLWLTIVVDLLTFALVVALGVVMLALVVYAAIQLFGGPQ